MVRTLHAIAVDDLSHMQGREPMRTAILQRGDISIRFSIQNDRLFQDRAVEQLTIGKIVGPGGDIPRIAEIGSADHFLLALEQVRIESGCARHRVHSIILSDYLSRHRYWSS